MHNLKTMKIQVMGLTHGDSAFGLHESNCRNACDPSNVSHYSSLVLPPFENGNLMPSHLKANTLLKYTG